MPEMLTLVKVEERMALLRFKMVRAEKETIKVEREKMSSGDKTLQIKKSRIPKFKVDRIKTLKEMPKSQLSKETKKRREGGDLDLLIYQAKNFFS